MMVETTAQPANPELDAPFQALRVDCPVSHTHGSDWRNPYLVDRTSAEVKGTLADGSSVVRLCRVCQGRGYILTAFGEEVLRLVDAETSAKLGKASG